MKIENRIESKVTETTLNQIPVGTIFKGTIIEPTRQSKGLWYKFSNGLISNAANDGPCKIDSEVLVICLDGLFSRCVLKCCPVEDYVPYPNAKLVIE